MKVNRINVYMSVTLIFSDIIGFSTIDTGGGNTGGNGGSTDPDDGEKDNGA